MGPHRWKLGSLGAYQTPLTSCNSLELPFIVVTGAVDRLIVLIGDGHSCYMQPMAAEKPETPQGMGCTRWKQGARPFFPFTNMVALVAIRARFERTTPR